MKSPLSNIRMSIFYLQQSIRFDGEDPKLYQALDLMCEVENERCKVNEKESQHKSDSPTIHPGT